ncbi:MAG: DUF2232 domain-containing protein [Oscillatoriales cyanobacterium SM2_2_1]|nr:DUF2232 domain-containing protein [Oscillatoriales cyanobacterium SM2_2_1]
MTQKTTLITVETAFLASANALIFLINFYFPVGPFLRMLFPLPVALAYLRWQRRAALMTMVVATLLLMVLMGPIRSFQYVFPHGILGVLLGFLWRRGYPWWITMGVGALTAVAGTLIQLAFLSVMVGENLWFYFVVQISGFLSWLSQWLGILAAPDLWLIQVMILGSIGISNGLYLLLVHLAGFALLDRLGHPIPAPPRWVQALLA